jgi:asparagine synthase (glutamine-hydrolysing)
MSGICGLFNLDDEPVTDGQLEAMTAMLEQRGPERTGYWRAGPLGLGYTLLATTPELQFERQPFTHQPTGCVITADVRIDNRDELLKALELEEQAEFTGDAELILSAYLAWGENCVGRLLGDFAFAIWDPRNSILFCARDHSGIRPFYFHHGPGSRFVFGSFPKAILVLPQVPYRIDPGRIADYLVPELEWIDYTSTFFENVSRLPLGHKATVSATLLKISEYWEPQPGPDPGPMSDDDYAHGFLSVFSEAVKARLRTPRGTVGSMMSGGIDSGSVVAIAKDILSDLGRGPLPTYSAVRERDVDCAESQAIYAASAMPAIVLHLIQLSETPKSYEALGSGYEEPYDGEFTMLKAIYLAASTQGQRVLLDGGSGDSVLGEGTYIARLIRHGQIRLAFAEIAAEKRRWDRSPGVFDFTRYVRMALVPAAVRVMYRKLRPRYRAADLLPHSLIARNFADSVNIKERCARLCETYGSGWIKDYASERCKVIRPHNTAGVERYARLAATAAIDACDPFLDKRVIEYSAWLPGPLRLRDGWRKVVLRDLMAGRLPDEVRWAHGKPHLGWLFNAAVTREAINRGELDLTQLSAELKDYVDPDALARAWFSFCDGSDLERLHSARVLSVWLRENRARPIVAR